MCIFNISCQSEDGSCQCASLVQRSAIFPVGPVSLGAISVSSALLPLYNLVFQQIQVIRSIKESLGSIIEGIASLEHPITRDLSLNVDSVNAPTAAQLKQYFCGETIHRYRLKPVNEIVNPAYKERIFSLMFRLIDAERNEVKLDKSIFCKLLLYTAENPPKVIKLNNSGDNILKGNTEMHGNSYFKFERIGINEVSSHFISGSFVLVVMPSDITEIAPFILEDFVVKARKMNLEAIARKKAKLK